MKKFLLWIVGIAITIFIIFTLVNLTFTYSEGNRAGHLIKFSHKGYVFKTWEGELNLGGINTVNGGVLINNIWLFSVADASVADSLSKLEGKDISLHYKEKLATLPWRGDSKYIVDKVVGVVNPK
ncbi:MAG: hypothetical protein ABJA90_08280 [Ginsengibacter sp.]